MVALFSPNNEEMLAKIRKIKIFPKKLGSEIVLPEKAQKSLWNDRKGIKITLKGVNGMGNTIVMPDSRKKQVKYFLRGPKKVRDRNKKMFGLDPPSGQKNMKTHM